MIERQVNQEEQESFICIVDSMYHISIHIETDNSFDEKIVVSLRENTIVTADSVTKNNKECLVPVIADSYNSINLETGKVSVKLFVQQGMKILPLDIMGFKCEDVFIVRESDIGHQLLDYCNQYICDLYTSDLKLGFDQIEVFSVLQQIGFTSYGRDTFSSLSLLIDSIAIQQDSISKQTADFALVTFAQSIQLTDNQVKDLIELLEEKYKVYAHEGINIILNRVKDILQMHLSVSAPRKIIV